MQLVIGNVVFWIETINDITFRRYEYFKQILVTCLAYLYKEMHWNVFCSMQCYFKITLFVICWLYAASKLLFTFFPHSFRLVYCLCTVRSRHDIYHWTLFSREEFRIDTWYLFRQRQEFPLTCKWDTLQISYDIYLVLLRNLVDIFVLFKFVVACCPFVSNGWSHASGFALCSYTNCIINEIDLLNCKWTETDLRN